MDGDFHEMDVVDPTGAMAGKQTGAMTFFDAGIGEIVSGNDWSGRTGFLHPGERANALHLDWHIGSYRIEEITEEMCEEPNP